MSLSIAARFLKEVGKQELNPPMTNAAILVQTSGFTRRKYFEKYYKDKLAYPVLVSMKGGQGTMYLPLTKSKNLAREFLARAETDPGYLAGIESNRKRFELEMRRRYAVMTEEYFRQGKEAALRELLQLVEEVWDYNASLYFVLAADEDMLDEASRPPLAQAPVLSMHTRHGWQVAQWVAEGIVGDQLDERCQFMFSNYAHVPSVEEAKEKLARDFGAYLLPGANDQINAEQREYEECQQAFEASLKYMPDIIRTEIMSLWYCMKVRDERKDILLMLSALCYRAAWTALDLVGLPRSAAPYLRISELLDTTALRQMDLMARLAGFDVMCSYDGECIVAQGEADRTRAVLEENYGKQQDPHSLATGDTLLKGKIAFPGKAAGRVVVIRDIQTEASRFREGDVLVTGMTRPEYVYLMKMASAIVTDEGGITCHAAIVAREMKKPCVIGTKVATQVLKDGDMVEVDAEKGIVRVLEQS